MKKILLLIAVVAVGSLALAYAKKTVILTFLSGSILHWSVIAGLYDFVEEQALAGADLNGRDYFEHTPLHWAVWSTDVQMIDLLVDNGASIDATNNLGMTPLSFATLKDEYRGAFYALLENGADPNIKGGEVFWTTLMTAVSMGQTDTEVYSALVAAGADVNEVGGRWDSTALHVAATSNNPAAAEFLISHGADVNAVATSGQTPLDSAMATEERTGESSATMVELLKEKGGRCNITCFADWRQRIIFPPLSQN